MAQNTNDAYRKFRYYEGVCSSSDFIKEIAKVVSLGVKNEAKYDTDGKLIQKAELIKALNWDIVYPTVDNSFNPGGTNESGKKISLSNRDDYLNDDIGVSQLSDEKYVEKLENQIAQITNKVILKTTTTDIDLVDSKQDDLSVSGETEKASTTMYLEIYKPKYIVNPETYPLDAELHGLTPQVITKEMYKEARKTKGSVIYDLINLVTFPDIGDFSNLKNGSASVKTSRDLITKKESNEIIDCQSEAYSSTDGYLFGDSGIFNGLCSIFNDRDLDNILPRPNGSQRVTSVLLNRTHLSSIKETNETLYKFLFGICGLKSSFTESDYSLIDEMNLKVALVDNNYYVTLTFNKIVEIYTVKLGGMLDFADEYGHESTEAVKPEIYSEGRYVPLPSKYLDQTNTKQVLFSSEEPLKFCLDKITNKSDVLYGTLVLRYDYDKNLQYTNLASLEVTDSTTLENNHYCLMRIFDNPNADFSGPEPNIYDDNGTVTATNSHTSPWSKLSWYQDFEEVMMDHIDEDVSITNIADGTLFVPLETVGLTSDTRISYWINTNNDRFSLVVMGNPALDYERDRHLISSCYCGKIESFENSVNDVSGNFALYTSSSTVPCKTSMESYDTEFHINRDFKNKHFLPNATGIVDDDVEFAAKYPDGTDQAGNLKEFYKYVNKIGGEMNYVKNLTSGFDTFYITLAGNKFFIRNEVAWYMALDMHGTPLALNGATGQAAIYYSQVAHQIPIYGTSDSRSNTMEFLIQELPSDTATVLFNFGYYEEKFVITSGVTRDVFGNVIDIDNIDDYGINTSDGTLSVSMYHTRSKAFYQKHHFLFATTEEYMSKSLYGKSSYTGEYYADRIKITHGNDGPRGILSDTLIIDNSSLYPKDELVINKDFEKEPQDLEETFAYFPVTAPYSPIADGPNARYGIALKKSERENYDAYSSEKLVKIATKELSVIMENYRIVNEDIPLRSKSENGCDIYWTVYDRVDKEDDESDLANWIYDIDGSDTVTINGQVKPCTRYNAHNFEVTYDEREKSNDTEAISNVEITIANNGAINDGRTENFNSYVTLSPASTQNISNIDHVYYGYSDKSLNDSSILLSDKTGYIITKVIDDGTNMNDSTHEYSYYNLFGSLYVDVNNEIDIDDIKTENNLKQFNLTLENANPEKYLNLFFTQEDADGNKLIRQYASIPLHYEGDDNDYTPEKAYNALLKYPCSVSVYASGITNNLTEGISVNNSIKDSVSYPYQPYNTGLQINLRGMNTVTYKIISDHYGSTGEPTSTSSATINIAADDVIDNMFIIITK